MIPFLLALSLLFQVSNFIQLGDKAYNEGRLEDALGYYLQGVSTAKDKEIKATAWLRCAFVQYSLSRNLEAFQSLVNMHLLTPEKTLDEQAFPPEFVRLFRLAGLEAQMVQQEPPKQVIPPEIELPNMSIPPPKFPPLPLKILPLPNPQRNPFYTPADSNPILEARELPDKIALKGQVAMMVVWFGKNNLSHGKVAFSHYPPFDRAIEASVVKWKIRQTPPKPQALTIILDLSSEIRKVRVVKIGYQRVEKEEPLPTFLPETYALSATPVAWEGAEPPEKMAGAPGEIKIKFKLQELQMRETFKGVAYLSSEGKITAYKATRSPLPALDKAILPYLKQWRFKPAKWKGKPIGCAINLEMELLFTLEEPDLVGYKVLRHSLVLP